MQLCIMRLNGVIVLRNHITPEFRAWPSRIQGYVRGVWTLMMATRLSVQLQHMSLVSALYLLLLRPSTHEPATVGKGVRNSVASGHV